MENKYKVEVIESVFYFVCTQNKMLNDAMESQIANNFAQALDIQRYGRRSGSLVQNPKALLEELQCVDDYMKYEIICLDVANDEVSMLSYDQKIQFVSILNKEKYYEFNSGQIVYEIIKGTEASSIPVFKSN